jgi:hypothetical protein
LRYVQGQCGSTRTPALSSAEGYKPGQCVLSVLHSWLRVETAPGDGLWISDLYIQGARDGQDRQEPCMLDLRGARVYLTGVTLVGDGYRGRGICAPSAQVYALGAPSLLS